jgi:hypothetical protein
MKKLFLIALVLCMFCAGTASAYGLYLTCPASVQAGQTLKCTIDSDLPAGTSFNLVFYQSLYTATELDRQPVTIQKDQATQYKLFDTRGYKGGQYKIEIQIDSGYLGDLRSDSVTSQLVTLIDRSGEITITSPTTQMLADALQIDGSIIKKGSDGVEIEVKGQNTGRVFNPQYIPTTKDMKSGAGIFTRKVTVTEADSYDVYFSDPDGLIGIVTFEVVTPAPTPIPTTIVQTTRTTIQTTPPTPSPTPTKSPLAEVVVIGALGITGVLFSRLPKKP